jgi:hypothetical protein
MRDVTSDSFVILIAYLIPGFIILWGLSQFSPDVRSWMGTAGKNGQSVGGFLYVTIASVAAGLSGPRGGPPSDPKIGSRAPCPSASRELRAANSLHFGRL